MAADPQPGDGGSFVDAYLLTRHLEGRLLPDDVVRSLPMLPDSDLRSSEWRQRAWSARRFVRYLARMGPPLRVCDMGCGNGWFTAQMAAVGDVLVVGIDVNSVELEQARRVFGERPRLEFREVDLRGSSQLVRQMDVVVLASALQYVADARALLDDLLEALPDRGEVHVLDTTIYRDDQLQQARQRTASHYASLGVTEMAEHYHHHPWSTFSGLSHEVLHRPDSFARRVQRRVLQPDMSPFPWIRVVKAAPR